MHEVLLTLDGSFSEYTATAEAGAKMSGELPPRREMGILLALAQVGIEMVAPIAVGHLLDRALGIVPWLTAAGAILGLFGGLVHLVMLRNKLDRTERSNRRDQP